MSLEALWTIEFGDGDGWKNAGVLVFETGRVFGGDSGFYYLGTVDISDDRLRASIRVVHYHGEPVTAFGDSAAEFHMNFDGERADGVVEGELSRVDFAPLRARLIWRADLPTGIA